MGLSVQTSFLVLLSPNSQDRLYTLHPLSLRCHFLFLVLSISGTFLAYTSVSHNSLFQYLLCDFLGPQGLPHTQRYIDFPPAYFCTSNPCCTHCKFPFLKFELGYGASCSKTVNVPAQCCLKCVVLEPLNQNSHCLIEIQILRSTDYL